MLTLAVCWALVSTTSLAAELVLGLLLRWCWVAVGPQGLSKHFKKETSVPTSQFCLHLDFKTMFSHYALVQIAKEPART